MQAQVLLRTYHRYLLVLPAQAGNAVQHIICLQPHAGVNAKKRVSFCKQRKPSQPKKLADYPVLRAWHVLAYWASVTAYTRCPCGKQEKNKAGMPQQSLLYAI